MSDWKAGESSFGTMSAAAQGRVACLAFPAKG
jgi:hypothetical protein